MKILVVSSTVFTIPVRGYSGLEHLAYQQAEGLAAKGYDVAIVAPEGSSCNRARVIPCGPPGGWDERTAFQHYQQILPQFDVIIDHSWQKWSMMAKVQGQIKCPILGVCHAPVNTMFQSIPPEKVISFVCISDDQKSHFEALFSRPARRAYNGVDLDYYKPMGIKRSNRFLFLARFSTIKGPDLAIEACRKAGVGLDLIGDTSITNEPELLEKCKDMAKDSNLQNIDNQKWYDLLVNEGKIRLIGPATRSECVQWFSQAHCLLHPNQRFREPFGLSPVESMACGCPVIAWDHGAMRETVKHGETGFLVQQMEGKPEIGGGLIDWIKNLSINPPKDRMRERCREWVAEQFSLQKMIDRYEELCKEAIETGGW